MLKTTRTGDTLASADPYINLAVAILQRAVDDAHGRRLYQHSEGARVRLVADARCWLQAGAGGLLAALDIDEQAFRRALAVENSPSNGAKR